MSYELRNRCATVIKFMETQALASLRCAIYAIVLWPLLCFWNAYATTFPLPEGDDSLIGEIRMATIQPGENLGDFLAKNQIGYIELAESNPNINLDSPQGDTTYVIPTQYILPDAPHHGIVINLSEPRLYYFPPSGGYVLTYPIGIGREGIDTPIIKTKIVEKRRYPVWVPTKATRERDALRGVTYPAFIPSGPDNPLGDYALRLGLEDYSIHGTNDPYGVGLKISYGCIRMSEEDIKELFSLVSVGTSVNIIDQPVKVGQSQGVLYAEVHRPLHAKDTNQDTIEEVTRLLVEILKKEEKKHPLEIDWSKAMAAASSQNGLPVAIGKVIKYKYAEFNPVYIFKSHVLR